MGKIVVQGCVNSLGVTSAAAFNAVNRTDDFAIVPEQNIAHAMSSVMAQNSGAKKYSRVKETFGWGVFLEMVFSVTIAAFLYIFSSQIMKLFTYDAEVIREGSDYLHLIAFMYPLPALTNVVQGYFRGIGDLRITLVSSVINMTVRCIVCWLLLFRFGFTFTAIPWSYLAGWIGMTLYEGPILLRHMKEKSLPEENQ
jgi:Na+-driven multidrug efflux pump